MKQPVTNSAFQEITHRELRIVIIFSAALALLNAVYLVFRVGHVAWGEATTASHVPIHTDYSLDIVRLKIGLSLLFICFALWSKRVVGLWVSLVLAIYVEFQFWLIYVDTQRWLAEMGVGEFSELPIPEEWPNTAGLYRAGPWDIVLLIFNSALLLWQVRAMIPTLLRLRRPR